jgi:hypothetical protein
MVRKGKTKGETKINLNFDFITHEKAPDDCAKRRRKTFLLK